MIGFLRWVGVLNAAVWLGGAVLYTAVVAPALVSSEMATLLQAPNFPYFSVAIEHIVLASYFHFLVACAIIALLHLLAEWLYLGRPTRKFSFSLLAALSVLALILGLWLQPRLKTLHESTRSMNPHTVERETVNRSYRTWHFASVLLNVVMIGGLAVYTWRVTNPLDTPRFISSVKFRG